MLRLASLDIRLLLEGGDDDDDDDDDIIIIISIMALGMPSFDINWIWPPHSSLSSSQFL